MEGRPPAPQGVRPREKPKPPALRSRASRLQSCGDKRLCWALVCGPGHCGRTHSHRLQPAVHPGLQLVGIMLLLEHLQPLSVTSRPEPRLLGTRLGPLGHVCHLTSPFPVPMSPRQSEFWAMACPLHVGAFTWGHVPELPGISVS